VPIVLASIWGRLAALPALYLGLWATLLVLTIALVILMRTPWGRERPTHRYVLLSLVAHLALICLATTVRFMSAPAGEEAASPIKVRIVMRSPPPAAVVEPIEDPVETPPEVMVEPKPEDVSQEQVEQAISAPPLLPLTPEPTPQEKPSESTERPATQQPVEQTPPPTERDATSIPQPVAPSSTKTQAEDAQTIPIAATPVMPATTQPAILQPSTPQSSTPQPRAPIEPLPAPQTTQPVTAEQPWTPYSVREPSERLKIVEQEGGSRATEDAVAAGLAWLASAQSRDGGWDASHWSAGRETRALGHDRRGAGAKADTGVTGLALLAFLGADHTHQGDSPHAETVRAGIAYLQGIQAADGCLAGDAALYAKTYCHSMATFAVAEALATTGDERLRPTVRRAVDWLVKRQHPSGGGWRYESGVEGDMSQMGWIIMALRSAELAGVATPPTVWSSIERFVRSTRRGTSGGLACYQVRGPVSRTMTAESLYCRQILGWPTAGSPATGEAVQHVLGQLPGQGKANLYYWYYAALALHHNRAADHQAKRAWQVWNSAMSRTLVGSQIDQGVVAGSWSPNTLWGGYGGRVYATALATMCLEVYYRYDHDEVARDPWLAARPATRSLR